MNDKNQLKIKPDWVVASHNQKKLKELQLLLEGMAHLTSFADYDIESPVEDGLTFVENALIKARVAAKITGLPALADDSGLVVPVLGGEPGLYSARYAFENATDQQNNEALIQALQKANMCYATAYYHCTLVFVLHALDPDPLIAQGRWYGRVCCEPKGDQGFGYDPLFLVAPEYIMTAGQLSADIKATQSHRGIAMRAFKKLLFNMLSETTIERS